jgi:hypothetical protein
MRLGTCVALAAVLAVAATPATAQSTTEDGVRAVLRGDYKAAVRILRPLADDFERPDPVAQFFLAVLYETGHGVKADMSRACGLFSRSASHGHPFSEQAAVVARNMRDQLGDAVSLMCVANETWQGGPPQSIALGPDHQIVFTDTSVTVTYGEQETRTFWKQPAEAFILPIRYTPIAVTRPVVGQRHFLQFFQWMPDESAKPSSWTLTWALSEVVGDQWLLITYEKSLAVVAGSARPELLNIKDLVRLRTTAKGEAEFTIGDGLSARTEIIPWQGKQ